MSVAPTDAVVSTDGVVGKEGSCIVTVGSTDSETEGDTDGLIESDSGGVSECSAETVWAAVSEEGADGDALHVARALKVRDCPADLVEVCLTDGPFMGEDEAVFVTMLAVAVSDRTGALSTGDEVTARVAYADTEAERRAVGLRVAPSVTTVGEGMDDAEPESMAAFVLVNVRVEVEVAVADVVEVAVLVTAAVALKVGRVVRVPVLDRTPLTVGDADGEIVRGVAIEMRSVIAWSQVPIKVKCSDGVDSKWRIPDESAMLATTCPAAFVTASAALAPMESRPISIISTRNTVAMPPAFGAARRTV